MNNQQILIIVHLNACLTVTEEYEAQCTITTTLSAVVQGLSSFDSVNTLTDVNANFAPFVQMLQCNSSISSGVQKSKILIENNWQKRSLE